MIADHLARNRVDRWFSGRDGQARHGHHAHPVAGFETNAAVAWATADSCNDQRTMSDVWIISGIFLDAGTGPTVS